MAATTIDINTPSYGTPIERYFAIKTSVTVEIGALVMSVLTTGRVTDAANTAGHELAGVVTELPDGSGTGNTAGTIRARVAWGHCVKLAVLTAARTYTSIGKTVFVADNKSVTDITAAGTAALRLNAGTLIEFTDSNKTDAYVWLRVPARRDAGV